MVEISREAYAAIYGPTTGDQVRLGDTDLWIEIEDDLTFGGEEAVFGGGKSIRESMAQGTTTRAAGALDTVITNAIVLDHTGIARADAAPRADDGGRYMLFAGGRIHRLGRRKCRLGLRERVFQGRGRQRLEQVIVNAAGDQIAI